MSILKPSSQTMAEIRDSANRGLAMNEKLNEIQFVFLEEDNPIEDLLKGIYRYRVVEKGNGRL